MSIADQQTFPFDGETFVPERDGVRLTKQWRDIWRYVSDEQWHTLRQISKATGHPEASVSARLRDFRKPKFGGHTVEREYMFDGLHMYRVTANPNVTVSLDSETTE